MTRPSLRLVALAAVFFATAGVTARGLRPERTPEHEPLRDLPRTMGEWRGQDAPALTTGVVSVLGVDDYVNRLYFASEVPVSLYVGYYASQRTGDTIHSPQNCLPGAGWQPVDTSRRSLAVPTRDTPVTINRLLIQKGLDRQIVYYWYQSHGRVVASDYQSKALLVWDALRTNRSDAALVRVITPIMTDGDAAADRRASAFIAELFPHLDPLLPR